MAGWGGGVSVWEGLWKPWRGRLTLGLVLKHCISAINNFVTHGALIKYL